MNKLKSDADFVHIRGDACVRLITDSAIIHLRGIHTTLHMIDCDQATITTAAFTHLHGIHSPETLGCFPAVRSAAAALRAESASLN
jgi:hypothetical protein